MTKETHLARVTQADRDAAAAVYLTTVDRPIYGTCEEMEHGSADSHPLVQAFARHREQALTLSRKEAVEVAVKALRPFADRVFNDNGDMTVNTAPFSYDEIVAAYFAIRSLALKEKQS